MTCLTPYLERGGQEVVLCGIEISVDGRCGKEAGIKLIMLCYERSNNVQQSKIQHFEHLLTCLS